MIKLPYKTIVDLVKLPSFFNGRLGLIFCIHIIYIAPSAWMVYLGSPKFSNQQWLVTNPEKILTRTGREPQPFQSLKPPGSSSVLAEF